MLVLLSAGLLALFVLFLRGRSSKIIVTRAPEHLRNSLDQYAKAYGFDPSTVEFILALSALETGRWTSSLYENNNNPWGMRDVKQRQTTDLNDGADGAFAVYKNIEAASLDFFYWLQARRAPKTFRDLRAFIEFTQSKGYDPTLSTDEYYSRVLSAIQ